MGFILMYDITNEESFNSVQDWWVKKTNEIIMLFIFQYVEKYGIRFNSNFVKQWNRKVYIYSMFYLFQVELLQESP